MKIEMCHKDVSQRLFNLSYMHIFSVDLFLIFLIYMASKHKSDTEALPKIVTEPEILATEHNILSGLPNPFLY